MNVSIFSSGMNSFTPLVKFTLIANGSLCTLLAQKCNRCILQQDIRILMYAFSHLRRTSFYRFFFYATTLLPEYSSMPRLFSFWSELERDSSAFLVSHSPAISHLNYVLHVPSRYTHYIWSLHSWWNANVHSHSGFPATQNAIQFSFCTLHACICWWHSGKIMWLSGRAPTHYLDNIDQRDLI